MLFSDATFFAFFAPYFALHLLTPPRFRLYLIIAGSTVFYGWWRIDYVWLPYLLTLIAWAGSLWIVGGGATRRRTRLIATLFALFAPLAIVKYLYFLVHDVIGLIPAASAVIGDGAGLKMSLPLGISFVTFTLTAYVVDVYRERYPLERSLTTLLGYVLFFPHLIAGPILRPNELMPQLRQLRRALDARFTLGVGLFTLGLVKKLVFANTLAEMVDAVYRPGANPSGPEYLLAIYGFSAQIYCDFSGYTDMAVGLAYLLRIRLPTNFRTPYASGSIIEFWRRWHITLSHWLRDYLYIPLGGGRRGRGRQLANMMITMLLGGLWHGANWTFVIWGGVHGVALGINHLARRATSWRLPRPLGLLLTFHVVTAAWILFRAPDLATAGRVASGPFLASWSDPAAALQTYLFQILLLAVFFATHGFDRQARVRLAVRRGLKAVIWPVMLLLLALAVTVSQGSSAKFIYFDF